MNLSNEITGTINVPFHGESAYEIAVRYGYEGSEEEWLESIGKLTDDEIEIIMDSMKKVTHGYTWYADTDKVVDKNNTSYGTLSKCMTDDFVGAWFYVRTNTSEAGFVQYPNTYTIDGANGYLSLRDYVVWTGAHLVHIPTFETKASSVKNSDGKYSPKSGVDGLMSSTDKAYLTDLINSYWGKSYLPIYSEPDHYEGWQTNWLFETGWYTGGIKKDCGGHPPVLNDNHTSWAILVLNSMATDAESLNRNHRVQIAFDVVNSKIYMRRGWMSANSWADSWNEVGGNTSTTISTVVFPKDGETVTLDENVKEIVVTEESVSFNVVFPENMWLYNSIILNLTAVEAAGSIDFGFGEGKMFGDDITWSAPEGGKMYMIVKIANLNTPGDYQMYEVDKITRQVI